LYKTWLLTILAVNYMPLSQFHTQAYEYEARLLARVVSPNHGLSDDYQLRSSEPAPSTPPQSAMQGGLIECANQEQVTKQDAYTDPRNYDIHQAQVQFSSGFAVESRL
jgi:hypothetical protein